MKYILTLLLIVSAFTLYAQDTGRRFTTGKVFHTQIGSGVNYFDVELTFLDEGGYFDGTSVAVGDMLFVSDGGKGYLLPVTELLSVGPVTVQVRVANLGLDIGGISSDLGYITKGTDKFKFMPFVGGLSNANQQISSEEFVSRLDSILEFKLTERVSGSSAPSYTPTSTQSWIAQNGAGDVYKFNGTNWTLVGTGAIITEAPISGIGILGNPISLDSFSIDDAYIKQNSIDSTELAQNGISLLNLNRNNANNNQSIKWNGTRWIPTDVVVNTTSPITGTGAIGSPITLGLNTLDSTFIKAGSISRTDIGQNGANVGQVLKWNGSGWIPSNDDTGMAASIDSVLLTSNNLGLTVKVNNVSSNTLKVSLNSIAQDGANNNQVIRWNGTTWIPTVDVLDGDKGHIDVVSSVWTVDTNTIGATQLISTGVAAGTYGSASQIPTFTVDQDGRITAVALNNVIDGTANNEGILGVANGGGSSAIITSNTSGASGVSILPGTGITLNTLTATNGGGITINADDASITNEGRLGVGGTGTTTRVINSNTSGNVGVSIVAGTGMSLSAVNSSNGGSITFNNTGDLLTTNEGNLSLFPFGANGGRITSNTSGSGSPKFVGTGNTTITVNNDTMFINSTSGISSVFTSGIITGDGTTGNRIRLDTTGLGDNEYFMVYNGSAWGAGTILTGGGIIGEGTSTNPLQLDDLGATLGQIIKWNGSAWVAANDSTGFNPSTALGGDLSGTLPNPNVVRIQNIPVSTTDPTLNQILKFNGTEYIPAVDTFRWALKAPNGTSVTPSYTFDASQGTGIYAVQGTVPRMTLVGASSTSSTRGTGITLTAGLNSSTGQGGAIALTGGNASSGTAGAVSLSGGYSNSGDGGNISLYAGDSNTGNAGQIYLFGGNSFTTTIGGNINLSPGNATTLQGVGKVIINGAGTVHPSYTRADANALLNKQIGQTVYITNDTAASGKIGGLASWNGTEWLPLYNESTSSAQTVNTTFPIIGNGLDTIITISTENAATGDVIRYNGQSWEFGSPIIDEQWLDFQASTISQTFTSPFTSTTDSENNFLIVSGTQGSNTLTVISGSGSLFDIIHGSVIKDKSTNSYYPVLITDISGSTVNVGQPLPVTFTNDTLKCIQESQNGQHFTRFGYYALADEMVRRKKYISDKTKYIQAFLPEKIGSSTTIPFEYYGGASTGGFVPGSSNTMFNQYQVNLANISINNQYRYFFQFDQGGAAGKGFRWTVNTGQHKGHLNLLMSVSNSGTANPPLALVKLKRKSDNTILHSKVVSGAGTQEIDFIFESEDELIFECETYNSDPVSVKINRAIWFYRVEEDTIKNTFADATKIVLYGDSWTVFHDSAIVKQLRAKLPGKTVLTKGRGGMTTKWGGRWIRQEILNMNPRPSHVIINFRINDHNSFGSSSTAWNFSSSGAYDVGTDVFGGISNGDEWNDSLQVMKQLLINNNIVPIFIEDHTTGSNSQQISQMDTVAKYWQPVKYYSTGKLTVTEQILGGNADLDNVFIDSLSSAANSFSRIWGRNNGVSQPSVILRPIDPNAGDAESIVIRPLSDRTAGNAFVIKDRQGNNIHEFKWAGATSTYSAGSIESGWFIANYPFGGGGFQTNGLSLSQNGSIGAISTNVTQSRFELGFGVAGYNSVWSKIKGTAATSAFNIYNNNDSVIVSATKDKFLGIGGQPYTSLHVYSNTPKISTYQNSSATISTFISNINPNSNITGNPGDIAFVNNSGTGEAYIKETGTDNTGWGKVVTSNTLNSSLPDFSVLAGTDSTSLIYLNPSSSNPLVLKTRDDLNISESGNTITLSSDPDVYEFDSFGDCTLPTITPTIYGPFYAHDINEECDRYFKWDFALASWVFISNSTLTPNKLLFSSFSGTPDAHPGTYTAGGTIFIGTPDSRRLSGREPFVYTGNLIASHVTGNQFCDVKIGAFGTIFDAYNEDRNQNEVYVRTNTTYRADNTPGNYRSPVVGDLMFNQMAKITRKYQAPYDPNADGSGVTWIDIKTTSVNAITKDVGTEVNFYTRKNTDPQWGSGGGNLVLQLKEDRDIRAANYALRNDSGTPTYIAGFNADGTLRSDLLSEISITETLGIDTDLGAPDGGILTWDQTSGEWTGTQLSAQFEEVNFSATAGATNFTLPITPATPTGSKMPIRVYRNGVKLIYSASAPSVHQFTYSGGTLTTSACNAGDIISVEYLNY